MADAMTYLNGGNVLNFVLPNTTDTPANCNNGFYITDTFTAEIGKEINNNERLSFQIDNIYIKNFSITENGISGDPITIPDNTAMGYQSQYYIDSNDCSASFVLDTDFIPKDHHKLLVAAYCTYDYGWGGTTNIINLEYLFYDVDGDALTSSPTNLQDENIFIEHFATIPTINAESCFYGNETTAEPAFNTFRNGVGYTYGTSGYARAIKEAGFVLATSYSTNIPVFDTYAHAVAYLKDNTITDGLLNGSTTPPDPEQDFINDQKYYKIKNLYASGGGSSWTPVKSINYRIKPIGGKICLYYHEPTLAEPYEWVLYNYSGYTFYSSMGVVYDDDDDFSLTENIDRHYLENSVKFGNNSYRVNIFDTDVPKWQSQQDADDYINGLKDITEALNYDYIARTNQEILGPDIGLADVGNDNGTNGMVYSYGSRMYVMSSSHLAGFFADVFNTANINDILDGTKLFGTNQINAISGINYFPCAISEFCTVVSPGATPHVGTWVCPTATSNGYITQNNKLIDCGGDFLKPIYNDFRDLEPYQQLWVTLPFCGTHQLQITKYLNKFISFKYSIDAVTGACSCHVYADGIELDTFDGVCASQRPITAIDQTTYLSNVIGSVNSALTSGVSAISSGAQAIGGAVTGNALSVVSGAAGMVGAGASGVMGAYNVLQAVDNPPMTTRGGSSGCLGFFGCTQIHLHFYQKKSVKPVHALMLCGAPSNVSGTVSTFAGFLKCSTFKMSDGFTGTNDELNEIMQLMKNGIYV